MVNVKILDGNRAVGRCSGPRPDGVCPREGADGLVACAGKLLDASAPEVEWSARVPVGEGAKKCPLRGFVLEDPDRSRWS
jgi:hypothetical protein